MSDRVSGPCALGFVHAVILLPRRLVDQLSDAELDQVIAHEHAHLHRYDDWTNLLQCGITAAIGIHPAIWLIARRLDLEREAACDDRVVAKTGLPDAYANCLARVATLLFAARHDDSALAPAVARSSALLRTRVRRLLNQRCNRTLPIRWARTAVATGLLGVVVIACDQAPPVVTFTDTGVRIPVAALRSSAENTVAALTHAPEVVGDDVRPRRASAREAAEAQPETAVPQAPPQERTPSVADAVAIGQTGTIGTSLGLQIAPAPASLTINTAEQTSAVALPASTARESSAPGPWSKIGLTVAQAGASIGKGAGTAGQSIGKGAGSAGESVAHFFSRVAWTGKKKGS
jgi:hypothetical protein